MEGVVYDLRSLAHALLPLAFLAANRRSSASTMSRRRC